MGDVFLHTLPHAMMDGKGDHDHIETIGIAILVGFLVFFVFDVVVRSFGHDHDNGHTDSHEKGHEHHSSTDKSKKSIFGVFSSTVILNLVADSMHNFTDGIAIGASFAGVSAETLTTVHDDPSSLFEKVLSLTQSRGGLASLAVLFHEIPHELGDYSILVSAGMSKKQAIVTQFSTAIAAYCGTFVGLLGMEQMKTALGYDYDLMIPFTAGGFIYLAAVTILPSLLEGKKTTFTMRIMHIMSFVVGIIFMYFVAVLEHNEGHGHSHSHSHHSHSHSEVDDHHDHRDHHDHDNEHHDHDEF